MLKSVFTIALQEMDINILQYTYIQCGKRFNATGVAQLFGNKFENNISHLHRDKAGNMIVIGVDLGEIKLDS